MPENITTVLNLPDVLAERDGFQFKRYHLRFVKDS